MKKVIIMGATSGIGLELAKLFINDGWKVGMCGRRIDRLRDFKTKLNATTSDRVEIQQIDVNDENSVSNLDLLIEKLGGLDLYIHSSGFGKTNPDLDIEIERKTILTNSLGFCTLVSHIYNFFKEKGSGHIVAITSVAGTNGLGTSASYSSSKMFQSKYLLSLSQLSRIHGKKVSISDIRPGFVETDFINRKYPMVMTLDYATKRIYKSILKKKRVAIIDWRYKILVAFWRLIPNSIWVRIKLSSPPSK